MKIIYTTSKYSPLKHDDGSGTDYRLFHAIKDQGVDLHYIGPFRDVPSFPEKIYRKIHALFSSKRPAKYSAAMLREGSNALREAVEILNLTQSSPRTLRAWCSTAHLCLLFTW